MNRTTVLSVSALMVLAIILLVQSDIDTVASEDSSSPVDRDETEQQQQRQRRRQQQPSYQTFYYGQMVDHFGFANMDTFKQRYLYSDQYWDGQGGPIFFYTGCEADIELISNHSGFIWDMASEFKAMLVFAEHRYYGMSMPYGPDPFKNVTNLNYLTAEQALADFAVLIRYLKAIIPGAQTSPVVAFGSSYCGMLAAWFRMKYPNMVIGALASSAPIWQFTGLTPCNTYYDSVTKTWADYSPVCADNIHRSYDTLQDIASQGGGLFYISLSFRLCTPLQNQGDLLRFFGTLTNMYSSFTEADYPYPANFLANLPAWPVDRACDFLSSPLSGRPLVKALSKVTNLFFNYSGDTKCVNWTADITPQLGNAGWNYQSCTEMVMPMCSNGSGMFPLIPWDFDAFSDYCYGMYNLRPRKDWTKLQFWGKSLESASNIIFSNGLLDPWSAGGVLQSISDTMIAIQIPYAAHSLDFRSSHPEDPHYVIDARQQEKNIIREWLEAAWDS